jgi:regulator of protease activity HflC (stomatin/prohibitin superfamily)
MDVFWLVFVLVFAGLIALAVKAVVVVPHAHVRNVERLGKFRATFKPGFHLIAPFIYRLRPMIDRREQVISLREPVITSDNVDLRIDIVLFFKVIDPYKADYKIANYFRAGEKLAGTVLRNVIGNMSLHAALTSREPINRELMTKINATSMPDWGIEVTRAEVMTIDPPQSVKDAMEHRQGAILRAEGEAEAIGKVFGAIHAGKPNERLLAYEYLEMLPKLTQGEGNTVVVIPSELTGALKALGSAFGAGPDSGSGPGAPAKPQAPAEPGGPGAVPAPAGDAGSGEAPAAGEPGERDVA